MHDLSLLVLSRWRLLIWARDTKRLSWYLDELRNTAILNTKGVDYGCVICNMSRSNAINKLNNSKFDDKNSLWIRTLVQIKSLLQWLKKEHLRQHILPTFTLVLIVHDKEIRGKSVMTVKYW